MDELQALAIEMGVGVDEPGRDRRPVEIDHARGTIAPGAHVGAGANGGDAAVPDGKARRAGAARIEGEDAAVEEDPVGRYRMNPFSR
jgi:hypothetical protein